MRFFHLDLPVFETALEHLLGKVDRLGCLFTEGLFDLYTGFGGDDDVQPVAFRRLSWRGDNRNRIPVVQYIFNRYVLFIYLGGNAFASQL